MSTRGKAGVLSRYLLPELASKERQNTTNWFLSVNCRAELPCPSASPCDLLGLTAVALQSVRNRTNRLTAAAYNHSARPVIRHLSPSRLRKSPCRMGQRLTVGFFCSCPGAKHNRLRQPHGRPPAKNTRAARFKQLPIEPMSQAMTREAEPVGAVRKTGGAVSWRSCHSRWLCPKTLVQSPFVATAYL